MSDATQRTPSSKDEGFNASISALRNILMLDSPTATMLKGPSSDEMERVRLKKELRIVKENLQSHKDRVNSLQKQLVETGEEAKRERSSRSAAEKLREELEKDNRSKTSQLETVSGRRQVSEEKVSLLEGKLKNQQEEHSQRVSQLNIHVQQSNKKAQNAFDQVGTAEARLATNERRVEEMIKKLTDTEHNFATERSRLQGTIQSLERSNDLLRGRVEATDATAKKHEQKVTKLTLELGETKSALNKAEARLKAAAESEASEGVKLKQYKEDLDAKISENRYLKEEIDKKDHEIHDIKKSSNENEKQHEKQRIELESSLTEKARKAESKYKAALTKLSTLQKLDVKHKQSEQAQTKLLSELEAKQRELKDKVSLARRQEKLIKLLKDKVETLERKTKDSKDEEVISLKQQLESEREEGKRTEAKLNAVSEELTETKDELLCAEEEVTRCREKLSQLEGKNTASDQKESERTSSNTVDEMQGLRDKLSKAEELLANAHAEAESRTGLLSTALEKKEKDLQQAQNAKAVMEKELMEHIKKAQTQVSSETNERCQQELARKDQEAQQVQSKLEAELSEKQTELETKVSSIREMEALIESLRNDSQALETRTKEGANEALEKARAAFTQTEAQWNVRMKAMTTELAETKDTLNVTESELTRCKTRISQERTEIPDALGAAMEELRDETGESFQEQTGEDHGSEEAGGVEVSSRKRAASVEFDEAGEPSINNATVPQASGPKRMRVDSGDAVVIDLVTSKERTEEPGWVELSRERDASVQSDEGGQHSTVATADDLPASQAPEPKRPRAGSDDVVVVD